MATERNPFPILAIHLYFFFVLFLITSATSTVSPYAPSDNILINCGFPSNITTSNGRNWTTDVGSNFIFSAQPNTSTAIEAPTQGISYSVPQIPYMTARLFYSQLTYSVPISPGPKFIRFYFYPTSYLDLDKTKTFFSISVCNFTLLHNFSASLTADYLNLEYFTKEFYFNVESHVLNIILTPTSSLSNGYGFINGIEIVSIPVNLYIRDEAGIPLVGEGSLFYVDNFTALETVYRLNVGGQEIQPEEDTGMFRTWSRDDNYIFGAAFGVTYYNSTVDIRYPSAVPNYTAPEIVYRTYRSMGPIPEINVNYNLTWLFSVDSGFFYLVRLHFCEIGYWITEENQRVFDIFIGNLTAIRGMDVLGYTGTNGVPTHKDYIVMVVQDESSSGKQDLWLALHPATKYKPRYYDAILNGLEIFKLNHTGGNLAGLNPPPTQPPVVHGRSKAPVREYQPASQNKVMVIIVGPAVGVFLTLGGLGLVFFFVSRRRGDVKVKVKDVISWWVPQRSNLCRRFSFAEIMTATENFDEARVIGIGGFGSVYKGQIDGGATTVAVKRGNLISAQGAREFQTEIEMLSNLRHIHLVSLIGFCQEGEELILVYDYMVRGTLRDHLYGAHNPPLSWNQRLKICIGVARGLHYLHSGAKHTIIHRDVKTTNILLDEEWVAKVSDFGLSRLGPTALSQTHVTTQVKGTIGYLDPEYYQYHQITEKSDVYSLGAVLFEVLCGRPPLDRNVEAEQVFLPGWAAQCYRNGTLDQIVDPCLRGKIASESLEIFGDVAVRCVADRGIERPTMSDVLWYLEFALQLQESKEECNTAVETEDEETPFTTSFRGGTDLQEDTLGVVSGAGDTVWSGGGRSMREWRRAISLKILIRSSSDSTHRWKMSMACGGRSMRRSEHADEGSPSKIQ